MIGMSPGDRVIWWTAWAFVGVMFLGVVVLGVMLLSGPPGPGPGPTVVIIGGFPYQL